MFYICALLAVLTRLLERVHAPGIRLKRLYLDRGFAQVDVLRHMKLQPYVSVIAIPKKGNRLKKLQRGKKSYTTKYTMNSPKYGSITFPLWIACRYGKGKAKKHGVQYLFFAVLGECKSPILQVVEEYRHRFGIESSYRMMNRTRAQTTSKNPKLRLLLVSIAFLLGNLRVWFKWNITLLSRRRQKKQQNFTLNTFCLFLTERIKKIYSVVNELNL